MKKQIAGIFCFLAGVLSVSLSAAASGEAPAPEYPDRCPFGYKWFQDESGNMECVLFSYDRRSENPTYCEDGKIFSSIWRNTDELRQEFPTSVFRCIPNPNAGKTRCEIHGTGINEKDRVHVCTTTPEDCGKYKNTEWDEEIEGDYKCVSMHYLPDGQYRECPEGQYWWYSHSKNALTYCAICENEFVCAHTEEECKAVGGDWRGNAKTNDHSLMCWRDKNARASIAVPPAPPFTIPSNLFSGPAFTPPPPTPTCASGEVFDKTGRGCRPRIQSDCEAGQILDSEECRDAASDEECRQIGFVSYEDGECVRASIASDCESTKRFYNGECITKCESLSPAEYLQRCIYQDHSIRKAQAPCPDGELPGWRSKCFSIAERCERRPNPVFTQLVMDELLRRDYGVGCPNPLPQTDSECYWESSPRVIGWVYDESVEGYCRRLTEEDCKERGHLRMTEFTSGNRYCTDRPECSPNNLEDCNRFECEGIGYAFVRDLVSKRMVCEPIADCGENYVLAEDNLCFCREGYRENDAGDTCEPVPKPLTFEEECEASGGQVVDSDVTNSGKACFYPAESSVLSRTPDEVPPATDAEAVQEAAAQLGIAQASYAPAQIQPDENRLPEYAAPAAILGALAFSSLYPDYELGSSFNYSGENGSLDWEAEMRGDFHHGSFSSFVSAVQSDSGFEIESGTAYQSDSFLASYTTVEAKNYMNYAVQLSAPWQHRGWNISPNLSSEFHYDRDENHSSSESGAGLDLEYRF